MEKKKSMRNTLILLAVLAGYFIFKGDDPNTRESGSDPETELSLPEIVDDRYELLENCRLVRNRRNDGDSFFVKHSKGETEFRLYYVDAPESAYKEYRGGENNGARLDDQAAYFDLDREGAVATGIEAKNYIYDLLGKGSFTVVTKWENVYGPERKYAFVIVDVLGQQVYLHEALVQKGLARIHTKPASLPSGESTKAQLKKLRGLESLAKSQGSGAWSQ